MNRNVYVVGHALDVLAAMPGGSVHCVVTSPPYYGLRSYGTEPVMWPDGWRSELGLEPTPELYLDHLVAVFEEVRRVLRSDGTCWLNIGDSYASGKGTCHNPGGGANSLGQYRKAAGAHPLDRGNKSTLLASGLKPKDLMLIPFRLALALQAAGWYVRQTIIWDKGNPMPESVEDRPTRSHEYIFLLSKSPRYFFDWYAIAEDLDRPEEAFRTTPARFGGAEKYHEARAQSRLHSWNEYVGTPTGKRRRRSVWRVSPQPYREAHFACFPEDLIKPCILAGTSERGCCPECGAPWERVLEQQKRFESGSGRSGNPINGKNGPRLQGGGDTGDIRKGPVCEYRTTGWQPSCPCGRDDSVPALVLDPFGGSGTAGRVCEDLGRDWLLIDVQPGYSGLAARRTAQVGLRIR